MGLPSLFVVSTTGSCAKRALGSRDVPAATATELMKSLRENLVNEGMISSWHKARTSKKELCAGYCIHYSHPPFRRKSSCPLSETNSICQHKLYCGLLRQLSGCR